MRQGKAFVWVDKQDGSMEVVGDMPFGLLEMMPGFALANLLLPATVNLSPSDTVNVYPVLEDESDLGPGPWIG